MLLSWEGLFTHTYQPAPAHGSVMVWPRGVDSISLDRKGENSQKIVVFAHPGCPCTRATLAELEEALTHGPADTAATIVFVTAGLPEALVDGSDTIAQAQQMNRVTVVIDSDANLAAQFGATISGEVFVFDAAGQRTFHGGITTGRGHRGRSSSRDHFEQAIRGQSDAANSTAQPAVDCPVFGCTLPARTPAVRE
jgi:hypothetical protein